MSEQLRADVRVYADRMIDLVADLHNAMEDDDKDRVRTAIEAMVGLVAMLRSSVDESDDDEDANDS